MKMRRILLVSTALLMLGSAFPVTEASVYPWACAVVDNTCTFVCPAGSYLFVTAVSGTVTLTCAGVTVTCTAGSEPCTDFGGPVGATDVATCTGGVGRCSISPASPEEPIIPPDPCPPQWTHTYGLGGSVGATSSTAAVSPGVGFVTVADTNTQDCNGDGFVGYDGDLDAGAGGGAFGYGPFAADCGHNEHGGNFLVVDFVAANVAFVVGADDQSKSNGDEDDRLPPCFTDGLISPGTDTDDCLTGVQYNAGSVGTCTGGGDGLVWVFLSGLEVVEDVVGGGGVGSSDPPTAGTITAF